MLEDWLKKLAPGEPGEMENEALSTRFCWPCTIIGLVSLAALLWLAYWALGLLLA